MHNDACCMLEEHRTSRVRLPSASAVVRTARTGRAERLGSCIARICDARGLQRERYGPEAGSCVAEQCRSASTQAALSPPHSCACPCWQCRICNARVWRIAHVTKRATTPTPPTIKFVERSRQAARRRACQLSQRHQHPAMDRSPPQHPCFRPTPTALLLQNTHHTHRHRHCRFIRST